MLADLPRGLPSTQASTATPRSEEGEADMETPCSSEGEAENEVGTKEVETVPRRATEM